MFTEQLNNTELRQGDIIQNAYFPKMKLDELYFFGNPTHPVSDPTSAFSVSAKKNSESYGMNWLEAQVSLTHGFLIVLSQCCDLNKCKTQSANALVLSPLLKIPRFLRKNEEQLNKVKENSNDFTKNLFFIFCKDPLPHDLVVDFSLTTSFFSTDYDFLLSQKILQMTDETRVKFKIKLMNHFGRATQEELDANIYPNKPQNNQNTP